MQKDTNYEQSTSKISAVHEPEGGESKTKQSRLENLLSPSSLANANKNDSTTEVFSSQKSHFAEYTTWKGIEYKTGIEKDDAVSFLVKELLDNALDYLEIGTRTTTNLIQPEIHVVIERSQEKYIRITVCNSSYQN
jgi:translation initiation factor 2 beta subunit (eIF-2beta)/eIF-5